MPSAATGFAELGALSVWRAAPAANFRPGPRRWLARGGLASLCALASAAALGAIWQAGVPDTVVQTRIVADGGGAAGRIALAEAALRFAPAADRPVSLDDGGAALLVTTQDRDAARAHRRTRSLVDAILNAPVAIAAPAPAAHVASPRAAMLADRARLLAASEGVDARAASVSAGLTSLARDMAAALRNAADRRPGRNTAEKGAAALAELQIQRFQLLSRYQADYPAVVVLDGQIRNLRAFLADEARRTDARPAAPEPADALIVAERDRLRGELTALDDRRRALSGELAALDGRLLATPEQDAASPPPFVPPVLVEGATIAGRGLDGRAVPMGVAGLAGLLLSAVPLFWWRRRTVAVPGRLVIEQVGPGMLGGTRHSALPAGQKLFALRLAEAAPRYSRS